MKIRHLSLSLASLFATACGPNVVSSGAPDAGQKAPVDAGTPADAGTESNPYPAGPYGVHVNSVIQDFVLPGYLATGDTVTCCSTSARAGASRATRSPRTSG